MRHLCDQCYDCGGIGVALMSQPRVQVIMHPGRKAAARTLGRNDCS